MAIEGTIYQRLLPVDRLESPLNMFIYNPQQSLAVHGVNGMPPAWIPAMQNELRLFNPIAAAFRSLSEVHPDIPVATLELQYEGPTNEIAAILHYGAVARRNPRSIYVHVREEQGPVRLTSSNSLYDALAYPLLFPHGNAFELSPGWTLRKIARFLLLTERRFQQFWRAANLYILDVVCRIEEDRLRFITNSINVANAYQHGLPPPHEIAQLDGPNDDPDQHHHVALPSSFVGSRAYRAEQVADALALSRAFGRPHGMVTVTTNPDWPELRTALRQNQTATSVPQVTNRVFAARLHKFLRKFKENFGKMAYFIHVIEFQKRGLPHAHIVFNSKDELPIASIDAVVSAEVPPPTQPRLRELILRYMVHPRTHIFNADGSPNTRSRCQRDGQCVYGFPQPITAETHLDPHTHRIVYRRRTEEDTMIAQYSPLLLLLWNGHCHIDIAMSPHTFIYMFKYISKGPDYAAYRLNHAQNPNAEQTAESVAADYINARYLSATEAMWRIYGFDLSSKSPTVIRLAVHAPQGNRAQFRGARQRGSEASTLLRYFLRPLPFAPLTYTEYYEAITTIRVATPEEQQNPRLLPPDTFLELTEPGLTFAPNLIRRRQRGLAVARINTVRPSAGDPFYIRAILLHRPARSWNSLRTTPDGQIHPTFRQAAIHEGIIEGDNEANAVMVEAITLHVSPADLRFLLGLLIKEGAPHPLDLWNTHKDPLCRDFLPLAFATLAAAPAETRLLAESAALAAIDAVLLSFGLMNAAVGLPAVPPHPPLTQDDRDFFAPQQHRLRTQAAQARAIFTDQQHDVRTSILQAILNPSPTTPRLHLIQGRAGRGKTFVVQAIVDELRGNGHIVAISAATGLAAAAFTRGMTVHKRFAIPVIEDEDQNQARPPLRSALPLHSQQAEFLRQASVIVVDEIWALSAEVLEAVSTFLKEALESESDFGGKVVVGVGDPRQTAPITKENSEQSTIEASFLASPLFPSFSIHELGPPQRQAGDGMLSTWVDRAGDDFSRQPIQLADMFNVLETLEDAKEFLFPPDVLANPRETIKRCFLTPLNYNVDAFNSLILDSLPSPFQTKLSRDSIKDADQSEMNEDDITAALETLAQITHPRIPNHELHVKEGEVCSILRNINVNAGLVKHARVLILHINPNSISVRLLTTGRTFTLPRVNFEFRPHGSPFRIIRKQFPLRPAYACTFHSCQGLTLDRSVIDATVPVFTHGQRYAALSRTRTRTHTCAYAPPDNPTEVNNIVYRPFITLQLLDDQ
ncbi:hypothetical protein CF326_g5630 [Tilletia indica]|nr:hypothetical protein CF326_g5630 [Tilletia indica]